MLAVLNLIFLFCHTELDLLIGSVAVRAAQLLEVKFQGLLLFACVTYSAVGIAMEQTARTFLVATAVGQEARVVLVRTAFNVALRFILRRFLATESTD